MKALTACIGECGRRRQLPQGWICDECHDNNKYREQLKFRLGIFFG